MDYSFDRRMGRRGGGGSPALDYIRLASSIAAAQAGSRTAATEARLGAAQTAPDSPIDALIQLFDSRFGWVSGVATLGGSFCPGLAGSAAIRAVDTP